LKQFYPLFIKITISLISTTCLVTNITSFLASKRNFIFFPSFHIQKATFPTIENTNNTLSKKLTLFDVMIGMGRDVTLNSNGMVYG
jgi:hypothetical protein